MDEIGSFDAKNRLSELLAKAERGEETIITRRGRPVAKLVPLSSGHDIEAPAEPCAASGRWRSK